MSPRKPFDVHGFDVALLDVNAIKQVVQAFRTEAMPADSEWQVTHIRSGEYADIYRLDPADDEQFPTLSVKVFKSDGAAEREHAVLAAIHDFGFSIGPRPFYNDETMLVTEWLFGDVLQAPPRPDEDAQWHRIMAMLGVPWNMPFAKYASQVAMRGSAPNAPGDVFALLDAQLVKLDNNHADYATLANLVESVKTQVAPEWNSPALITLNHLNPRVHHFIFDGAHMRLVDWQHADWSDKAYAVGQLCAHPEYVHMSSQHWVWYRWELSRLDRDQTLKARATTYTNMLYVYWAVRRTHEISSLSRASGHVSVQLQEQRDTYLARAKRAFGIKK